jgi:predicted small metal-binding protein
VTTGCLARRHRRSPTGRRVEAERCVQRSRSASWCLNGLLRQYLDSNDARVEGTKHPGAVDDFGDGEEGACLPGVDSGAGCEEALSALSLLPPFAVAASSSRGMMSKSVETVSNERKVKTMKSFCCGSVVPGCTMTFEAEDSGGILELVRAHARKDHGVSDFSDDLVAAVNANIMVAA